MDSEDRAERTTLEKSRSDFSREFLAHENLAVHMASSLGASRNEREYFKTHLKRYLATFDLIPHAGFGQSVLELGAAYHHLTPLLLTHKGFSRVRCTDLWDGGVRQLTREVRSGDHTLEVVVDKVDMEQAPWPYKDQEFDTVICSEVLEHLSSDPMCMLAEVNRVLKPGGQFVITTPNIASARSLMSLLRGESPYVFGKFEMGGRMTDHHNREYTPAELTRLLDSAGFSVLSLDTRDVWWVGYQDASDDLPFPGLPRALLGDDIFCLSQRVSGTRERYPSEFYSRTGVQSARRAHQLFETG